MQWKWALEQKGFHTTGANSGAAALDCLLQTGANINLLITSTMADGAGAELLVQGVRAEARFEDHYGRWLR
jgi:hypothetical protein